jgi:hypothetical protein
MYARLMVIFLIVCLAVIAIELAAERTAGSAPVVVTAAAVAASPGVASLDRRIADVDFRAIPMAEALTSLARQSGASILVDWPRLTAIGITPDRPITLRLHDVSLRTALDRLAVQFPSRVVHIVDYGNANGGIIAVSTLRFAPNSLRIWDIADLIPHDPPNCEDLNALRTDVGELVRVIAPLYEPVDPSGWDSKLAAWGTRLISDGRPQDHLVVQRALDCLRQPISLSAPATGRSNAVDPATQRTTSRQQWPARLRSRPTTLRQALAVWRQEAGPDASICLSPSLENGYDIPLRVEPADPIPGLEAIIAAAGYDQLGTYEEDGILHVARISDCRLLRAYDVSDLIAHPKRWAPHPIDPENPLSEEDKEKWLINLIAIDPGAWNLDREEFKFRAQYWNGRILICQSAEIHQHVLARLRSLQEGKSPLRDVDGGVRNGRITLPNRDPGMPTH